MDFLDPRASSRLEGRYERGYLPHVRSQGRSYFVTFRLEGTLPQEVLREYLAEREALLAKARAARAFERDVERPAGCGHADFRGGCAETQDRPVGKPALQGAELPVGKPALQGANLRVGKGALRDGISVGEGFSAAERHRLFELYSEKIEGYLDAGRGDCWLRDPRIGELVASALRFFDDQRYDLGPWVVMPNHVHVILRPHPRYLLDQIVKSWKGFTACAANRMLKRTRCCFWAREYYDHLIRNEEERARLADYIQDNPVKAGLCAQWQDWPWSSAHPRWR